MSTTSKIGADMQKEILDKLYELRPSDNDRGRHHFERVADDIRAILARQPSAIDKQDAVGQWIHCSPSLLNAGVSCANTPRRACECNPENGGHDHFIAHSAAPLANEASKPDASEGWKPELLYGPCQNVCWTQDMVPREERIDAVVISHTDYERLLAAPHAAPSVEQDERGAFEAWYRKEIHDATMYRRDVKGSDRYGEYCQWFHEESWKAWQARAASTSANVAQGADRCAGCLQRCTNNPPDCYAAPPAQHKSDWHPDFVTALYDNADPDKRYTMDQMREYADAFHRSRLDAALTAAQSASGDMK